MNNMLTKYNIPVAVWAVLIMIVSSIPYLGPPPIQFTYVDKVEHFIEYAILGALFAFGLSKSRKGPVFLTVLLICAAYGIFDELHQLFIPGRNCDPFDAAADILGAAAGAGIYVFLSGKLACLSFRQASSGDIK
jgi:VanZ family protein